MQNKEKLQKLFTDEDTFASTLLVLLTDLTGSTEFLNWEPETTKHEIKYLLGIDVPRDNMDKIQALGLALTTNLFYTDIATFMHVCNALGGEGVDFEVFDPAEMDEMAWTVTEVLLNDPQEDEGNPFSLDIQKYIKAQAELEQFSKLPSMLKIGMAPDTNYNASADLGEEFLAANIQEQSQKVKEIESEVQTKLQALMSQIQSTPLLHADPEAWQEFAGKPLLKINHRI